MVAFKTRFSLLNEENVRIDKLLSDLLPFSRTRVQNSLKNELVNCNGKIVSDRSFKKFKARDCIEIVIQSMKEPNAKAEEIPLNILEENDDFLIIDKPAGLVVHPAPGHPDGTLVNALVHHFEKQGLPEDSIPGTEKFRPGIVHRIDKDTSGLLVAAKRIKAFTYLSSLFRGHNIGREYIAFVWGCPDETSGTIESGHSRDPVNRKRFTPNSRKGGRRAVTHYRLIEKYRYASKISLHLETGRTHQIRMHMKHIGHPVINDKLYGGVIKSGSSELNHLNALSDRQMLHAAELSFNFEEKVFSFRSELPEDMQNLEDILKKLTFHRRKI